MAKVHRAYRHTWHHPSKEITTRDYQAMCNFADEKVSLETLAEHFRGKLALIEDELVKTNTYGYRLRRDIQRHKVSGDLGCATKGLTWWESDHSDPLELVKLYYPLCLAELAAYASSETSAKEKLRQERDWNAYFVKECGDDYIGQSDEHKLELIAWAESVHAKGRVPVLTYG